MIVNDSLRLNKLLTTRDWFPDISRRHGPIRKDRKPFDSKNDRSGGLESCPLSIWRKDKGILSKIIS